MIKWIYGLGFSLFIGELIIWLFLKKLRNYIGDKPNLQEGAKGIPGWVTGIVERLFFTIIIGLEVSGIPTAMVAWLGLKLLTNWNHPDWKDRPGARDFALSALLAGLISMFFAIFGGLICFGKINFVI